MEVVEIIIVVFIAVDTIMKIRDWVITFLESKRETTDDTPVLLTRKDRDNLRAIIKTASEEHSTLLEWSLRNAMGIRYMMAKVAPEDLRKFDDEILTQRHR